jgi:hypothetical protein
MAPVNIDFANALDLGAALPISNVQSDINDAGVNFTVFYKFTCPANLTMVWAWATSEQTSGYTPKSVPYDQTQTEILNESTSIPPVVLGNNPIQFPVTPGQVHYIQVVKNADTAGPEHVNLEIRAVPNESVIPVRAVIINGDTQGGPQQACGVFSPGTNYRVIKFVQGVAVGEAGCITKTGLILFDNRVLGDRKIKLYDANLAELGNDAILAFADIRRNQTTGWFWVNVKENAGFSRLYKVDPTVLPLTKTLVATIADGTGNQQGIATNNAETIAYFSHNAFNDGIKRWDLSLDIAMSDLVAAPNANMLLLDILCLEDDSIIAGWSFDDGSPDTYANPRRYDAAGIQLNDYGNYVSYENEFGIVRLAYDPDSPNSFWVKLREMDSITKEPTGDAIFHRIRVSDGVVLQTVRHMEYNERNYIGPAATSYRGEAGLWNSCPMVIMAIGNPETLEGGILFGNPTLRHDVYPDQARKIPNPTIRTAYIGD